MTLNRPRLLRAGPCHSRAATNGVVAATRQAVATPDGTCPPSSRREFPLPECMVCGGAGEVPVPVHQDMDSGEYDVEWMPCRCVGGIW